MFMPDKYNSHDQNYERYDFESILYIFQQINKDLENDFFLYIASAKNWQCRWSTLRWVNEPRMLKECLHRHEKILLRYCETDKSCEWRRRYFGALRRHELCLTEWSGTSLSTPPYFSYTVLTFSKNTFPWIKIVSKSFLTSNK